MPQRSPSRIAPATKKKTAPPKLIRNAGLILAARRWFGAAKPLEPAFSVGSDGLFTLPLRNLLPACTGSEAMNGLSHMIIPPAAIEWPVSSFFPVPPVSVQNIHAIPIEGVSPQQAADEYEAIMKRHYGADTTDPNLNRALSDLALARDKEGRSHDLTVHRPVRSRAISPYGEQQDEAGNCRTRPDRRRDDTGWVGSPRRVSSLAHRSHCRVRGMCAAMRMGHA